MRLGFCQGDFRLPPKQDYHNKRPVASDESHFTGLTLDEDRNFDTNNDIATTHRILDVKNTIKSYFPMVTRKEYIVWHKVGGTLWFCQ